MSMKNFLKVLFPASAGRRLSGGPRLRKPSAFRPRLEPLDGRIMPVINAAASYPTTIFPGQGSDGIVRVLTPTGSLTGSLLFTGRHILTAAHGVDFDVDSDGNGKFDRGDGKVDAGTHRIQFDLPGRAPVVLSVPAANITIHNQWNGVFNQGSDIAIIRLDELAPLDAERRFIYRDDQEVAQGQRFPFIGYGSTNRIDGKGNVLSGNFDHTGAMPAQGGVGAFGIKRIGFNRVDQVLNLVPGSKNAFDEYLTFDLDSPTSPTDMGVAGEALSAPGDSGGPLLINGLIAGVSSGGSRVISFGARAIYTRVSAYRDWIDQTVDGAYDLVLDMKNQLPGDNKSQDRITFITGTIPLFGERLFINVNGRNGFDDALNNVKSVTIRGSGDDDVITIPSQLGRLITIDGNVGNDELVLQNPSLLTSQFKLAEGVATTNIGSTSTVVFFNNIDRLSVEAGRSDIVNVNGGRPETPVTVSGGKDVFVNIRGVRAAVTVNGNNRTALTVSDINVSAAVFNIHSDNLSARFDGVSRTLIYRELGSLTINGGDRGNVFFISNTPAVPVTLNTGLGVDTVNVFGTTGALIINGKDSRTKNGPDGIDTVTIGSGGSVQSIRNTVSVTNTGAYTALTVDNFLDTAARSATLSRAGGSTVLSGLTPGGNIVAITRDLRSLSILTGSGKNTFRIDDTPTSNTLGGVTTTLTTLLGNDNVTVNGTTGRLVLNSTGGDDTTIVGSDSTGLDRILGAVTLAGNQTKTSVTIFDRPSTADRDLTHTITPTGYSRTAAAAVNLSNVKSLLLQTGGAQDTINVRGNPTAQLFSFDIQTGAGNDVINVGSATNQLAGIGLVTVNGETGTDTLNLNDQGSVTPNPYTFGVAGKPYFTSPDANISHANNENTVLNGSSGGSSVAVLGTQAGNILTVNGFAGASDRFEVTAVTNAIRGQVRLRGQKGDGDVATYEDAGNADAHAYTLTTATVSRTNLGGNSNLAQVIFSGLDQMILYTPRVGGSTVNVRSVGDTVLASLVVADRDTVTISSLNRRLNNILGPVAVRSYTPEDRVSLIVDDSGNAALTQKNVRLTPPISPTDLGNHIEDFSRNTLYWNLGSNASIAIRGGAADETFTLTSTSFAAAINIDGGGGVNTLDYSAISGDSVAVPQAVSFYTGEGNANDSVGGNNGTTNGDITFNPGQVGQAFDFTGVGDYIDLGNDPSLDLPGSMSVALWVRLDSLDHAKYFFADFAANGNTTQGSLGTPNELDVFSFIQSYDTDGSFETLRGTTPIRLNEWFHLAVVRDDAAKTVRLYVNGVEDGILNYAGKTVVPLQGNKLLGGSGAAFPQDSIDGQLDEVGIYNRPLSLAEIRTLYTPIAAPVGVVVNLQLGTASGLTGGIARIQNVVGSSGDDILVGNGGNVLSGGLGRDLLIAGAFASTLNGGGDDDILIGGTTNYDRNDASLRAILAEWTISHTTSLLNANTVFSNGFINQLAGDAGSDRFFTRLGNEMIDFDPLIDNWTIIV